MEALHREAKPTGTKRNGRILTQFNSVNEAENFWVYRSSRQGEKLIFSYEIL